MGKSKEEKKWNACLEKAPVCAETYENLQRDKLQTSTDKDASITDISLTSSSIKRKKKKKRHSLLEQQADGSFSTEQHMESLQNNREKKKKRKLTEEEAIQVEDLENENSSAEEPKRKKKKKEKYLDMNESKETQSSEPNEDVPKKKKKLKESKENNTVALQEDGLTIELETQSDKKVKKRKKLKDESLDRLSTQHKQVEAVSTTEEAQTSDHEEANPDVQTGEVIEIDAKLLSEIKYFIPDIEKKEVKRIRKFIKYDLPRYKEFKRQGIPLKKGRFTANENEILRTNIKDFMTLTGIDRPDKLFFTNRFKQEEESIKKLKRLYRFFERIAEGIPRSCYYIYARGRKMFDEENYCGVFSKEELHNLNKLHTLHGNNWKKISELTGRSATSVQKRYSQISDKYGYWSKMEVQRLLRGVRDYILAKFPGTTEGHGSLRITKETLYKCLPWQKISMKVKTRSWIQCRAKWMGILVNKMSFGNIYKEKKALDVQVKLIKWMYEIEVDDPAIVNWEDLTAQIGDVPPTYLQRKWHKLKVCHVPNWQGKCFADTVDFLYEKVLPELEGKLTFLKDVDKIQDTANDESYLFSYIFQDINEDEDVDDNNSENQDNKQQ